MVISVLKPTRFGCYKNEHFVTLCIRLYDNGTIKSRFRWYLNNTQIIKLRFIWSPKLRYWNIFVLTNYTKTHGRFLNECNNEGETYYLFYQIFSWRCSQRQKFSHFRACRKFLIAYLVRIYCKIYIYWKG